MKRIKKEYLKYLILHKYTSITDAAEEIGINYFRLSRYLSSAVKLNSAEMNNLRCKLKLTEAAFAKAQN